MTELIVPLALEQEWFFARRIAYGGSRISVARTFDIDGPLDVGRFLTAFRNVIDGHQGLRTNIRISDSGETHQVIHPPSEDMPLICQSVACESREQFERYARSAARADVTTRWNPVRDSLYQMRLLRRSEDEHILLSAFDHLAFDDRAAELFFHYLWAEYRGEEAPPATGAGQHTAGDLAGSVRAERERYASRAKANAEYWLRRYALAPATWTANGHVAPPTGSHRKRASTRVDLDADSTAKVRAAAAAAGASMLDACVSVFAWTVFQVSAQDRVAIYVPFDNRAVADRGVIGNFACVRPLVVDRADGPGAAYLGQVARQIFRALAYRHMDWPSEQRCELSQLAGAPGDRPTRTLAVNYLRSDGAEVPTEPVAGLSARRADYSPVLPTRADVALTLTVRDWPETLRLVFTYTEGLFTPEQAKAALSSCAAQLLAFGSPATGVTPDSPLPAR